MSKTWDIKGLRGVDDDLVTIATVHELEYHGEWMGDEYVAVDIKSAEPVELRFGDYLIYRGDKFVIDYDPSMIKKARSGSYGEAFTYDNVKLFSVARELNNIQFRDVVLNDNGVHTAMSRFQFFAASVEDLADRIQANMNRHSGGAWVVFTPNKNRWLQRKPVYIQESAWNNLYGSSDPTAIVGETDINVDCQDLTCSGALAMVYNTFKVPFVVRGHSIIIGAPAVSADKIFKYGIRNGLYEIERTANDEQIVTMLYAYGSENNMPLNYYANIKKHMVVTGVRDSHDMGQGFVVYGLRTQVLYSSVKNALTRDDTQCILQYGNVTVKANADASLNGGESYGTQYLYFSFHSDEVDHTDEAFYNALGSGTVTVTIKSGTNINQLPDSMIAIDSAETYPTALSVNRLMLPGFPDRSLRDWVSAAARGEFIMPGYDNLNESMRIATQIATARVFSDDPLSPWIKSHFAGTFGVKEGSIYFDGSSNQKDIKPTIEGTGADIVTVGSTITDNGYLTEGTDASFEITIASNGVLDWSSAWTSHIEDVYIEMKSGFCTGRKFKLLSEPELTDSGWKMKLEREKDTSMSRYFPYHDNDLSDYAQVVSGDKFVVTGIDLPKGYVDAASVQLLIESCKALDLLDHPNRTYLPKIDEIYMQRQDDEAKASDGEITSLHDTLRAGMTLSMLDTDLEISVDSTIDVITIKENGNNGIPTYDVVLRDQKEKGLLNIVDDRIDKAVNGYPLSDMLNYGELSALFLSKQSDDTAKGLIRFIRGLQVGERFVTGLLGEGGIFRKEADGTTYIEADKLYIRMKAYFDSVEIRDYRHSAGNRIASVAGAKCCRVDWIDASGNSLKQTSENLASTVLFRCYFRGSDGEDEVRNNFIVGDLAYCHITTVETEDDSPIAKGLNMTHYWRLIVGRNAHGTLTDDGEHWIDLSNRVSETVTISGTSYTRKGYQPGSDVPAAQNDIIQLGNIRDTDRQGAIIEFVTGADAPSYQIFQGIGSDADDTYSLEGKNYVRFGYDSESGGAQAYIGNPDGSTYLWYHNVTEGGVTHPKLEIKAEVSLSSTFGGKSFEELVVEYAPEGWTEEEINQLIVDETDPLFSDIETALDTIQRQVDGSISTWFYDGTPTLSNLPASEWTTADLKNEHLGDLYYDNLTGYGYRFKYDETSRQWSWVRITDVDVTKALADAAKAQDTADHKRRVFVVQPTPPYDKGDLWVNATYPSGNTETNAAQNKYYNDVLRCNTTKASGTTFAIADWELASKYTDDTAFNNFFANTYQPFVTQIQSQVDGKAETWYQATDPSAAWNTSALRQAHVGDIWHNTSSATVSGVEAGQDAIWSGSDWKPSTVPQEVYDKIDGKADIFVSKPSTYNTNDMWIIESGLASSDMPSGCVVGDIVISSASRKNSYTKSDWKKKDRYTDDSSLIAFIGGYTGTAQELQNQIDKKAETWYQATNPASASGWVAADHVGDLWYCTADISGTSYKAGTTWYYKDNGASASPRYAWVQQDIPDAVFDMIDGKAQIFVSQPSNYHAKDLWILASDTTVNGVACKQGEVLVSSADSATYNQAHWSRKLRYTDDSALNTFLNGYAGTLTGITNLITNAQNAADAAQQSADDANALAATANYLKQAFLDNTGQAQTTDIVGGLVLSTIVALRDTNKKVWSGISGSYQAQETGTGYKGHGIAAWYGGGMVDGEVSTSSSDAAKSLFRFDGSGYVASGNLSWDKNGNVTIQGYSINATTLQVGGSNVVTEGVLANYVTIATAQTITGAKTFGTADGSYIQIGAVRIVYDATNNALKIVGSNGSSAANLYATGSVSALGAGSGGSSGTGDVTWALLASSSDTRQIALSHLTNALSSYATQSWVNSQIAGMSTSLAGLSDVNVSGVTSGQYLKFNGQGWVADTPSGGTTSTRNLVIGGVDYTVTSPYTTNINVDNVYLKLSGGTVTGKLTIAASNYASQLTIKRSDSASDTVIRYENSSGFLGLIGVSGYGYPYFTSNADGSNEQKIWTSGNDGSGSGLDADLLDGHDSGYFATAITRNIVVNGLNYTVNSPYNTDINLDNVYLKSATAASTYLPLSGGTMTGNLTVSGYYEPSITVYKSGVATDQLRIGASGNHGLYTDGKGFWCYLDTSGNGHFVGNADSATTSAACTGNAATATSAATCTGNSATATTLQTSRTIWGQSFDGSGNVSGTLTSSNFSIRDSSTNPYLNLPCGGNNWYLQSLSDGIYLGSTSTKSLKVDASGNVGIGTTSPSYKLDVAGTFRASGNSSIGGTLGVTGAATLSSTLSVSGTTTIQSIEIGNTNEINATGSTTLHLQYRNTGNLVLCNNGKNVGIGVSPSYKLHVSGDVYATGGVTCLSDIREKNILGQTRITVEQIAKMPSVVYRWKDNGDDHDEHVGSIAQDWQKKLPQVVLTAKDEKKTLSMQYGVAALVSAITIARKVVDHERRIKELEDENRKLKEQLKIA